MNFASIKFLIFMVVVFSLYWSLKGRLRILLILGANYAFYSLFGWRFILPLLILTILNYICGNRIERGTSRASKKVWLSISLLGSLGTLAYLKYFGFFVGAVADIFTSLGFQMSHLELKILLPVGISYYTFQMLTYTLDIYREQLKPTRSFLIFAAYSSFFAHIIAGPITRARQLLPQLEKERVFQIENLEVGLTRFLSGYFKKVFIADTLATYLVDPVFHSPGTYSPGALWMAAVGYAVQIYADFSGYSSMAIGIARILGLKIPENFMFPYLSRNIAEFWRRWHITLSRWLRDYLWWSLAKKIPFSGNFKTRIQWNAALICVFLVCGLWHGASWTFVLWGALHGIYIAIYESWHRWRNARSEASHFPNGLGVILAWLITQSAVGLAWLLFRAENFASFWTYLTGMFQASGTSSIQIPPIVLIAFAAFLVDHIIGWLGETRPDLKASIPPFTKGIVYAAMILFLFYERPEQIQQFIYFKF
jgi:alginate O-acetyltransferase complex protein AlgI